MNTEITDETPVSNVNELAAILAVNYGEIKTIENLADTLAVVMGTPMKDVKVVIGIKPESGERTLPNIVCGDAKTRIILTKANGIRSSIHFPTTVGSIDAQMDSLRKAKTDEEEAFEKFQADLLGKLDGYGHMNWTVGNEDWVACADAVAGLFNGKVYVATHVVVDCESGGWTDTLHKEVWPVEGEPPRGTLSSFLDSCCEHYANEQDDETCQIDIDQCLQAIKDFDAHVARLWEIKPDAPQETFDVVFDESEQEEPFDPMAMGWVGSDGLP